MRDNLVVSGVASAATLALGASAGEQSSVYWMQLSFWWIKPGETPVLADIR